MFQGPFADAPQVLKLDPILFRAAPLTAGSGKRVRGCVSLLVLIDNRITWQFKESKICPKLTYGQVPNEIGLRKLGVFEEVYQVPAMIHQVVDEHYNNLKPNS